MKYIVPLSLIACLWLGCSNNQTVQDELSNATPHQFVTDKISTGPLQRTLLTQTIECTGKIEIPPSDVYSIHSRAEGYVSSLIKLPGDRVTRGEDLLEIENPQFIGMQREVYEMQHLYETAKSQFGRQRVLFEKDATTAKQFEQARGQYLVTRSNYLGLLAELESTGIQIDTSSKSPEYQKSIQILSPVNGRISAVSTNMGKYVESHDELMTITADDHIHLELFILEKDIDKVRLGQRVEFSISSSAGNVYNAEIIKINSVTDGRSGTVMAHCHILTEGLNLKGGVFATAQIELEAEELVGLSREAVVQIGNERYGYVVSDDEYTQVRLLNAIDHGDFISFEPTPEQIDAVWVTSGAYYIQ